MGLQLSIADEWRPILGIQSSDPSIVRVTQIECRKQRLIRWRKLRLNNTTTWTTWLLKLPSATYGYSTKREVEEEEKQMTNPIPENVKKLWDKWNIRGVILFSLSLQTLLILLAPLRKGTANKLLILLIWTGKGRMSEPDPVQPDNIGFDDTAYHEFLQRQAYLESLNYPINPNPPLIISEPNSSQPSAPSPSPEPEPPVPNRNRSEPWSCLHLGGPDTITAFALEDNELWLRHLLGLIFQAVAAVYVFLQSLPKNILAVPAGLMFLAGIIKYLERTRALYLASLDRFRDSMLKQPDPGPNYAKLMEEYASKREARLPTQIIMIPEPDKESKPTRNVVFQGELNDLQVVHYAFLYFNIFKGLLVDLSFSFRERNESRDFFHSRTPEDAFRVIELWEFIFDELKRKSQFTDDPEAAKRISSAKGDWVLQDYGSKTDLSKLMSYDSDVAYDESLLLWHIATELVYHCDDKIDEKNYNDRDFSKVLSDYMLYLLVMQPTMMSAVAGIGKIRFRDTCDEAERFFTRKKLKANEEKKACEHIMSVNTDKMSDNVPISTDSIGTANIATGNETGSGSATTLNVQALLWKYVTKIDKVGKGGGNVSFRYNFCMNVYKGSYTRVKNHLMKVRGSEIASCSRVTNANVLEMYWKCKRQWKKWN
ncbi:hypothetical protein Ddye_001268 [Dipteronia dyeriana]|uniref:DUF4220 domain-containing protein n=1 Tax=Dipteronia dyeriana TaxID=168575 RepID=A0AAE0CTD1_9ROSI|nr:hypothetical protein Ddye_001268 [Dipteronia dyeriana]